MMDFYLPDKIYKIVCDKPFITDDIGMSNSSVLIFDDMVLKIQPSLKRTENEHIMMNWLKNIEDMVVKVELIKEYLKKPLMN
jgi:kanamycin kinase/aminoglycoside 3'-phosphotransferase-3